MVIAFPFDHAGQTRACSNTSRHRFTLFLKKIVQGLPLLYAREFRAPNIYLLLSLSGGQMDISGGFVTALHMPRHRVDIWFIFFELCRAKSSRDARARLQDVFFLSYFFFHCSKAAGRTRACVGLSEPNLCQLLSMFGGIVDISKGPGSRHTWSVR